MNRGLAWLLLILCAALLVIPAVPAGQEGDWYAASGRALALPEIVMPDGTVSVNMADLYELTELPGVGETIGQAIIDERESGGYFYYPEDLMAVRGIGEKTLEGLRDWLDMALPEGE